MEMEVTDDLDDVANESLSTNNNDYSFLQNNNKYYESSKFS